MTVLRVYDPAECDGRGVPLDWERCRTCEGKGRRRHGWAGTMPDAGYACSSCDGYGSLKAAALAWLTENRCAGMMTREQQATLVHANGVRCEDCGHPMSEGTWEGEWIAPRSGTREDRLLDDLRQDLEPQVGTVHYSPCDEGCRHYGPARFRKTPNDRWTGIRPPAEGDDPIGLLPEEGYEVEASWRQVDVRTLGWPHDLRAEKLAVLCLRCWAAR